MPKGRGKKGTVCPRKRKTPVPTESIFENPYLSGTSLQEPHASTVATPAPEMQAANQPSQNSSLHLSFPQSQFQFHGFSQPFSSINQYQSSIWIFLFTTTPTTSIFTAYSFYIVQNSWKCERMCWLPQPVWKKRRCMMICASGIRSGENIHLPALRVKADLRIFIITLIPSVYGFVAVGLYLIRLKYLLTFLLS